MNKYNIQHANIAYAQTMCEREYKSLDLDKVWDNVKSKIESAISKGELSTTWLGCLPLAMLQSLRDNGYQIGLVYMPKNAAFKQEAFFTEISWGKEL